MTVNRADPSRDPIVKYLQHQLRENTPKSKAILVKADQAADGLNLDDVLLDGLLARLKLE